MKFLHAIFVSILTISIAHSAGGGGSGDSGDSLSDKNYSNITNNSDLSKIIVQIRKENFADALSSLESYVYENPNDADGWNYIGFVSRKLKKYDDAERYYEVGLEIKPDHIGILEYQGELYFETNRLEMAIENLAKLNELCIFDCTGRNILKKLILSANE